MNQTSQIKNLCNDPKIFIIDNFLSYEECDHFIKLTENKLTRAKVTGNNNLIVTKGRTNRNCWVEHNFDDITSNVASRISKLVKLPIERAESFQLIHYDQGQHYGFHLDGFPIDNSDKSHNYLNKGGQRMLTALVYLNTVEKGGGTKFSSQDLTVDAKKGRIVIFENVYKNSNEPHQKSYHSGMPVIKGEKYAFNL